MNYTKIRVEFKAFPKRFYREMYVKSNLSLYHLGVVLCCALKAEFEHYFLFKDSIREYIPKDFEDMFGNDVFMSKYYLKDIVLDKKNQFTFLYDTGEDYEFNVTVLEKNVNLNKRKVAIILSGAGDRIWEDNISTLYDYLSGKIDGEISESDEENGIYMPWNVYEGYKLKDFDKFNVKNLDEVINGEFQIALMNLEEKGVRY